MPTKKQTRRVKKIKIKMWALVWKDDKELVSIYVDEIVFFPTKEQADREKKSWESRDIQVVPINITYTI